MTVRPFRSLPLSGVVLHCLILATILFAPLVSQAQTTLAAETGNNTAACTAAGSPAHCLAAFNGMSDATSGVYNPPPGNVSNVDIHDLLYPGNSTLVMAHLQGWFCMGGISLVTGSKSAQCEKHIQVGYNSDNSGTVDAQINDMARRGIDGIVLDWYGTVIDPNRHNTTALAIRDNLDVRCRTDVNCPRLALMEDEGAFKWTDCPQNGGGRNQTNCLIGALERDLQYMDANYFGHDSYLRVDSYGARAINGRPVVLFFICEECWYNPTPNWTTVWNTVRSYADTLTHRPYFIFHNAGGFTHTQTNGAFAWVDWYSSNDYFGLTYLDNFYDTAVGFYDTTTGLPKLLAQGASWKGFDETGAPWINSGARTMGQQCGRTWLQTFQQLAHNNDFVGSRPLPFFGIVTWNDYEEGTEVETGIDNCLSMSASVSGSVLSWTPAFSSGGSEVSVHHYIVFDSLDGQNLTAVAELAAGTRSFDLKSLTLAQGTHTLYVKAVGQPSILNHMSDGVLYAVGVPAPVVLSTLTLNPVTVTGGTPSQGTVTLSAAAAAATTVALGSSNSSIASVPGSITVAQGQSSGNFEITTSAVQSSTQVTISASYAGVTRTAPLTVNPAQTTPSQFSIVVLPDTQNYNNDPYPNTFSAITDWIVANRDSLNIQAVMGEGDITNYANEKNVDVYWKNARAGVKALDTANIPYVLALGNHDYDNMYPASSRSVSGYLNNFFKDSDTDPPLTKRYPAHKCGGGPAAGCWFIEDYPAGTYRNLRADITVNGKRYILLALELYPPNAVLTWAQGIIEANSGTNYAEILITTHSFVWPDDNTRVALCQGNYQGDANNWGLQGDNDAEEMWHALVRNYKNVSLVVNGHFSSTTVYANHRQDLGVNGNLVNQMIADYQDFPNGGNGYVRILTFDEAANTIHVRTYSPTLNQFLDEGKPDSETAGNSQFDVKWHKVEPGGTATFNGYVRRASDCSVVSNASVTATGSGTPVSTSTAGDGSFTLKVPAAAGSTNLYTVQVSGTGIATVSDQANAFTGFPAYLKFHVADATVTTGSITGTVRNSATNAAISGANVSYGGSGSATTNASGAYTLSNVPAGSVSLTASATGYSSSTVPVSVTAGATTIQDFSLTPDAPPTTGSITGTVTSTTGKLLRGATVRISDTSSSVIVIVTTGSNGTYDSGQIAVGTYNASASKGGYLPSNSQSAIVTSGNVTAGVNFSLQRK